MAPWSTTPHLDRAHPVQLARRCRRDLEVADVHLARRWRRKHARPAGSAASTCRRRTGRAARPPRRARRRGRRRRARRRRGPRAVDVHQPVGADPRAPPRPAHSVSRSRRTPERRASVAADEDRTQPQHRRAPVAAPATTPQAVPRSRVETSGAEANSGTIGSARWAPTSPEAVPATTPRSTAGSWPRPPPSCRSSPRDPASSAGPPGHGPGTATCGHALTTSTSSAISGAADADTTASPGSRPRWTRRSPTGPASVELPATTTSWADSAYVVRARSVGAVVGEPQLGPGAGGTDVTARRDSVEVHHHGAGREAGTRGSCADADRRLVLGVQPDAGEPAGVRSGGSGRDTSAGARAGSQAWDIETSDGPLLWTTTVSRPLPDRRPGPDRAAGGASIRRPAVGRPDVTACPPGVPTR